MPEDLMGMECGALGDFTGFDAALFVASCLHSVNLPTTLPTGALCPMILDETLTLKNI